jgi:sialate O-acetylesterase
VIPGGPDESIPADAGEQPFVHPLFSDHVVLQRDAHTPVWGWSKPGDMVTVKIAGKSYSVAADQYGRWLVRIGPFPADAQAYQLEISGPQSVTFQDVKFGDVWLCSGQSNMEFSVGGVLDSAAEIAGSANDDLRSFLVKRASIRAPRQTFPETGAKWNVVGPSNIGGFSAVCYFMVRELQKKLKVPMGMIGSYWGGTSVEWWTSREKLATVEDFTQPLAALPDPLPANQPTLTSLYNGMIAPLLPFGLKGIAWYQGENNGGAGPQYSRLMPNMIEDFRTRFRMGKLPFFQVQLANFKANANAPAGPIDVYSGWAQLREAQLRTRLADDEGGMAVIIDVGNPDDIHPTDKQDVGLRLAASALHVAYGQGDVFEGPIYESLSVQGSKIQISFDQVGDGLMVGKKDGKSTAPVAKDPAGTLSGFAIAGADALWKPASAVIDADGKTVTVSANEVASPVAVRYGWTDNPTCNLYNQLGLPATPFRTDADYRVNVNDGDGSGAFPAGKTVMVTAHAPPTGQHFVKWVGDVAGLDDVNKATATLTLPKAYVSIRATYAP